MVMFSLVAAAGLPLAVGRHCCTCIVDATCRFPNPGVCIMFAAQRQLCSRMPEEYYAVLSGTGADTVVRLVCQVTAAALIVRGARGTCMSATMLMHTFDVLC